MPQRSVVQPFSHEGTPDIKFHIAIPSYENVFRLEKVDILRRGVVAVQFMLSYCQENLFRADMYVCQLTFYENTEAFFLSFCIIR
jgi:hypothetical protein